ncbi:hypothetical protein H0H93_003112 [Arthromyces matolae]|nr:hypothetical protein H0H93_003112 [Arthromyces matolae]
MRDGRLSKVCERCLQKKAHKDAEKRRQRDSDASSSASDDIIDDTSNLGIIDLNTFLASLEELANTEEIMSLEACVELSSLLTDAEPRNAADQLAQKIWECLKYRFVTYHSKRYPFSRFVYNCAQLNTRQHKPKKKGEGSKSRDKDCMDTFECSGWLNIRIFDDDPVVFVKLTHKDDHIPYWTIDVPDETKTFIRENLSLTPTQLWDHILETNPTPPFSKKAIYHIWHEHNSQKWKRSEDEVESARKLIQEAMQIDNGRSELYKVAPITLHSEDGFTAIAFALPGILDQWGNKIREISLDSTWESGGKERFITDFLASFRDTWGIEPQFTLTDKDFSEINGFQNVYPNAKHQLCFWHCLRAVKQRLATLRRRPKHYHVLDAKAEYSWIDEKFVPVSQSEDPNHIIEAATKARPQLLLRIDGKLQNTAPEPQSVAPRLVVRLNGHVRSIVPIPETVLNRTNLSTDSMEERHASDSDSDDDDDDNLLSQVRRQSNDVNDQECEDGPDWMFEEGEKTSKDPNYVFCPAPHRKKLLHIFTQHFCQHPLFPERLNDGEWTAEQIRRNAVYRMYTFCYERGLCEVWAYMWESWYSPKMWKLWARSSNPTHISRLRTTMNVENFWRQLKHEYLHGHARPRLDHLVWVLIHKVTPSYVSRAEVLTDGYRIGRSRSLTTYQKYFKASWLKHLEKSLGDNASRYITDIEAWTCTCGQQKYDRHHICKHLVQAVGRPENPRFWREIIRRRTRPIYSHPQIGIVEGLSGSITDGDDHDWEGKHDDLKSSQWRDLGDFTLPKKRGGILLVKNASIEVEHVNKRRRLHNIVDLTNSSPSPEETAPIPSYNTPPSQDHEIIDISASSPSPSGIVDGVSESILSWNDCNDSEDEMEVDHYEQEIRKKIEAFRAAAQIMSDQLECKTRTRIWMKSVCDRKLGNDVMEFVDDIRRHEKTGRKRVTTWGDGGGKREKQLDEYTEGGNDKTLKSSIGDLREVTLPEQLVGSIAFTVYFVDLGINSSLKFPFTFEATAGSGVDIYVVGIYTNHIEFGGRARWGATFGGYASADGHGHGTHCAGTAVGRTVGVARAANVIAVKVLNDQNISGLDWVYQQALATRRPSVASLSLYADSPNTAFDDAVTQVAAGNNNADATFASPSRAAGAIVVGASTINDTRASFSNYGSVVALFAAGENVISAGNTDPTATPHVAGLVAFLISSQGNTSPASMRTRVQNLALNGVLENIPSGTINKLAQNGLAVVN